MTRVEWAIVRSAMGRPRRLSACFLREERQRLERHRRDVRMIQEGNPDAYAFHAIPGDSPVAEHFASLKGAKTVTTAPLLTIGMNTHQKFQMLKYGRCTIARVCCDVHGLHCPHLPSVAALHGHLRSSRSGCGGRVA